LETELAVRLDDLLAAEGLTQAAAAKRMGIAQPNVSELKHYKLGRFSSERLLLFLG
jgi:predicted XRE-type DNA-binding protein